MTEPGELGEHTHAHERAGLDLESAQQLVEQHKQQRLRQFHDELAALCQKHGVSLGTTPVQIYVKLADEGCVMTAGGAR